MTSLQFTMLNLQPPLSPREANQTIYVRNQSDITLTAIEPCTSVFDSASAQRIGHLNIRFRSLNSNEVLGHACEADVRLAPGQMVRATVFVSGRDPGLVPGNYSFTAVFGAVGSSGDGPIQPPTGMVSWWPGDGHALDIVGGNHGTLTGDFAPGKVGQGFSLDGTGDFVLVPDNPNLNITGDVTVDLWAKRTVFGQSGFLVSKGAGAIGGVDVPSAFPLSFSSGDQLRGFFERSDASNVFLFGPAVTDSDFHHFAYLRVGQEHALFMDGVEVASAIFTGDAGDTSGLPAVIGAIRSDTGPSGFLAHFGGIIDEVEIFNRALSDAEIRAIFEAGSAGKIKPTLPFLGWHFDTPIPGTHVDNPKIRSAIDLAINEVGIDPDFFFLANWPSLEGAIQSFDLTQAQIFLAEAGEADGFGNLCIDTVGIGTAVANEMVKHLAVVGILAVVGGTSCAAGLLFVEGF